MTTPLRGRATAADLRRQVSSLNLATCEDANHEVTFGSTASVIYFEDDNGLHGNFLPETYRRICADPEWRQRLDKAYTSSSRVPRGWERRRGELECANSSDALLMNVFCYPRLLHSASLCSLLGVSRGCRPEFGVRAYLPMQHEEVDRTELDMRLGSLLVESKFTETGFGTATRERVTRYIDLPHIFHVEELPWSREKLHGYQLVRGVLSAFAADARYVLLCDERRTDLQEMWFRVLCAVRSCEVRSRMALLSWQELAACAPSKLKAFLLRKYGIHAAY